MTDGYAMTPEGLAALREELHDLETNGRREVAERIRIAREWGDLKENGEYHAAKEAQAHLETRIARLTERLRGAVEVKAEDTPAGIVGFGTTVTVRDESTGRESTYTLVGAAEADISSGKLSIESPVATALVGAKQGETVELATPGGTRALQIVSVGTAD